MKLINFYNRILEIKVCMCVFKAVDKGLLSYPKKCKVEVFSCRCHKFMEVTVATLQSIRSEDIFHLFLAEK